jgi:hypothetical protein
MLRVTHQPAPPAAAKAARARRKARSEAQARWRKNDREGKRLVRVPVDAAVLAGWSGITPAHANDLADVGRLVGEVQNCRSIHADRHGAVRLLALINRLRAISRLAPLLRPDHRETHRATCWSLADATYHLNGGYSVSQPGLHGEVRTAQLGSVSRVPAPDIEQAIVSALRRHLADDQFRGEFNDEQIRFDRTTLTTMISRIEVQRNQIVISVKPTNGTIEPEVLSILWQKPPSKRARQILLPHGKSRDNLRPEHAERRARLVCGIARGRRWLQEIVTGSITDAEHLAKRERCTVRQVNLTLSLAFLAPQLGSCRRTPPTRHQYRALAGSSR